MPQSVLVTWIGKTDLDAARGQRGAGRGPIGQAVDANQYERIQLLCNYAKAEGERYCAWLAKQSERDVRIHQCRLSSPINFREIYLAVRGVLESLRKELGPNAKITYHLSPGTPAMTAVWILLAKTSYPARLIQSSAQLGVQEADIPFDIAAEFIPELLRSSDRRLIEGAQALPDKAPGFEDIVHRSLEMKRVIRMAAKAAVRPVPVLIEGESGTGKELLARAIHRASSRSQELFIAVNCGAVPPELVESEFFGHKKGAFTGATESRRGHFEYADRGTLFLDEVGELPKPAQVKLLRALQEGEIVPVGESKARKVDVRVIAATNRSLSDDVAVGRFREDLFFRLAVAVIKLPPLRGRSGDLGLLIDALLTQVNQTAASEPGHLDKKLSVSARKLMLEHMWPGNVRELFNTLLRATVWTDGEQISSEVMRGAIFAPIGRNDLAAGVLNRQLGEGFSLEKVMADVARHYLERAVKEAHGNKTQAAKLIGLSNYQTFTNWLKKYGLE